MLLNDPSLRSSLSTLTEITVACFATAGSRPDIGNPSNRSCKAFPRDILDLCLAKVERQTHQKTKAGVVMMS
ncbi:Hypothetical protein NTJ_13510 [Nesidiocoris tenuis]|uniref:KIND domain-containing protein n=1 Tax=Nesidiocoris tenuis TaxID=355587 RepID=A0ABN7B8I2_9HEMI|nr:Hypothetical protein NTJ_13510 [Nesidiocoris tenuis]